MSSPLFHHDLDLFIGLMSGTSLDGVDGVISAFSAALGAVPVTTLASAYLPFSTGLRAELIALQTGGQNEIEREALVANTLTAHYAACVERLLIEAGVQPAQIRAIGVHGQTIRHRPELGFTRQTNNPSLLAELTGIDVIADFRSRDVAAGGQGAPLVPAFHQAVFAAPTQTRVVVNIGGIANISVLHAQANAAAHQQMIGFDTGPGNVLMDLWIKHHHGKDYDDAGRWAASGQYSPALLAQMCEEDYFAAAPPKSTGRDLFNDAWLTQQLHRSAQLTATTATDVQATLALLTATTIAKAIARHAPEVQAVYVCGGGAYNSYLIRQLAQALQAQGLSGASVDSTELLGIAPNHVEAVAFAWLAMRFEQRLAGNLPAVTGARGSRILGALYPA